MGSREESEEEAPRENIEAQDLEVNTKQMVTVTVTDPGEVEMGTTGGDSGVVSDFLMSKKEVKWCWALLGLRIAAFVFCLIAFSVLAADKQKVLVEIPVQVYTYDYTVQMPYSFYWYHYAEFKYCFSANVIGFVYSVFQIGDLLRYLITKNTQNPKLKGYFTIAMDQVLAYVLMSASTSAATASHLFRSYWAVRGGHEFTEMANASVVLSFLAFVAFALASRL